MELKETTHLRLLSLGYETGRVPKNVYFLPLFGKFFLKHHAPVLSINFIFEVFFNPSQHSFSEPNKIYYIHVYCNTHALIMFHSNYLL